MCLPSYVDILNFPTSRLKLPSLPMVLPPTYKTLFVGSVAPVLRDCEQGKLGPKHSDGNIYIYKKIERK